MDDVEFERSLRDLDLGLFAKINSQTSQNDKRSLLACQASARQLVNEYVYLEIGSYMGGSLQSYVLDDRCRKIISIDKRPSLASDVRGVDQVYKNNTTSVMLENLRQLSHQTVVKIECLDGDVSEIDPGRITQKPHICFIDGEHTDEAAWNDFMFCHSVMAPDGAVFFHDSMIVYNSLARIVKFLGDEGIPYKAYNLPDSVFVIEIGDFAMHMSPAISEMLINNHVGYLSSLRYNDQYRRFANRTFFRALRNLKMKISGANVAR